MIFNCFNLNPIDIPALVSAIGTLIIAGIAIFQYQKSLETIKQSEIQFRDSIKAINKLEVQSNIRTKTNVQFELDKLINILVDRTNDVFDSRDTNPNDMLIRYENDLALANQIVFSIQLMDQKIEIYF